jgi:hypothetical protein
MAKKGIAFGQREREYPSGRKAWSRQSQTAKGFWPDMAATENVSGRTVWCLQTYLPSPLRMESQRSHHAHAGALRHFADVQCRT